MMTVDSGSLDAPSQSDSVVHGASEAIGGPLGVHATRPRNRFVVASAVVIALASFVLMLHWVQKSDCSDGDWVKLSEYRHACYTDIVALYNSEGLANGEIPYADHPVEYPVLTGAYMAFVGLPVHAYAKSHPGTNEYSLYYNLSALGLGLAAIATVIALLELRRRRPWDVVMFAVAPSLLLTATVNWDLLAVAFAVFAILAWSRERTALAGILIGLGTAAKLWPALLLIPLLLLAWRARKLGDAVFAVSIAALTWFAVNLPIMLLYPDAWSKFFSLNVTRGIDWGTFWYIGSHAPLPGNRAGLGFFHTLELSHSDAQHHLVRAVWPLMSRAGLPDVRGAPPSPSGATSIPDGRRVSDLLQGLVAAVRVVAAPSGVAGATAMGRVHRVATR